MKIEDASSKNLDDYWQEAELVARVPLPPSDNENALYFLWHHSSERYGRDHREIGMTLKEAGERDYVHVKACYYVPRVILTVGLTTPVHTELGEEIGQVLDAEQEGSDRYFIAGLQAWYYRSVRTLMLWEVDLSAQYSTANPTEDFLLSTLWQHFEQRLLEQFADCERIVTPAWEPKYDSEQYQAFLQDRGFSPHCDNTFIKTIQPKPAEVS